VLHHGHSQLEFNANECSKLLSEAIEQRKVKPLQASTTKLILALPKETEYIPHLEKTSRILSEYVICMQEIDKKREDLLHQRAQLMGTVPSRQNG
jgi:hypothetical protein